MSSTGNSGFFGNRAPAPSGTAGNSVGPERDAWNNVVKKEPLNTGGDNNNDKNGDKGNSNDPNNTGIDDDTIHNIWEEVKAENSGGDNKGGNNGGGNNNPSNNPPPDPQKQLSDYLSSVGLEPMVLSDVEKEEMRNGNFDSVLAKLNQRTVNAHVKALSGSKTMIEAAVQKAMADATKNVESRVAGRESVRMLNEALPFTKDKAVGPIAQAVMQKFLNKGMTNEDAIKGTERFFKHTAGLVEPSRSVNKNINSGFRSSNGNNDESGNDWLSILSPNS